MEQRQINPTQTNLCKNHPNLGDGGIGNLTFHRGLNAGNVCGNKCSNYPHDSHENSHTRLKF